MPTGPASQRGRHRPSRPGPQSRVTRCQYEARPDVTHANDIPRSWSRSEGSVSQNSRTSGGSLVILIAGTARQS